MKTQAQPEVKPVLRPSIALLPAQSRLAQRRCACGGIAGPDGECAACRAKRLGLQQQTASQANPAPKLPPGYNFRNIPVKSGMAGGPFPSLRPSISFSARSQTSTEAPQEEDQGGGLVVVAQAGTTPDGNTLGPTDPTKQCCLGPTRLIWTGGVGTNTATAATGRSRVTAHLGSAPGDGPNCDCGCGLFRQFIRGFWRTGSATAPKQFDIGSCGNTITMNESTFTEEFEGCNPGGAPISADCDRVYTDAPGFAAGLADGTFIQMHLVLRYQMWDQCRGREVATGDRTLNISGDRSPRTITFS